jgi:hypothetical protein
MRSGACTLLKRLVGSDRAADVSGHDRTGECKIHLYAATEWEDLVCGASSLSGWPRQPSLDSPGPKPASLEPLYLMGLPRAALNALGRKFFYVVDGLSLPSFMDPYKLEPFFDRMLATKIMYYPADLVSGEVRPITTWLEKCVLEERLAGGDVFQTLHTWSKAISDRFTLDNAHMLVESRAGPDLAPMVAAFQSLSSTVSNLQRTVASLATQLSELERASKAGSSSLLAAMSRLTLAPPAAPAAVAPSAVGSALAEAPVDAGAAAGSPSAAAASPGAAASLSPAAAMLPPSLGLRHIDSAAPYITLSSLTVGDIVRRRAQGGSFIFEPKNKTQCDSLVNFVYEAVKCLATPAQMAILECTDKVIDADGRATSMFAKEAEATMTTRDLCETIKARLEVASLDRGLDIDGFGPASMLKANALEYRLSFIVKHEKKGAPDFSMREAKALFSSAPGPAEAAKIAERLARLRASRGGAKRPRDDAGSAGGGGGGGDGAAAVGGGAAAAAAGGGEAAAAPSSSPSPAPTGAGWYGGMFGAPRHYLSSKPGARRGGGAGGRGRGRRS